METKTLKIFVSDSVGVCDTIPTKKKKPMVVRDFPFFRRVFCFINVVFIGSNIESRPPTFSFKSNLALSQV